MVSAVTKTRTGLGLGLGWTGMDWNKTGAEDSYNDFPGIEAFSKPGTVSIECLQVT